MDQGDQVDEVVPDCIPGGMGAVMPAAWLGGFAAVLGHGIAGRSARSGGFGVCVLTRACPDRPRTLSSAGVAEPRGGDGVGRMVMEEAVAIGTAAINSWVGLYLRSYLAMWR